MVDVLNSSHFKALSTSCNQRSLVMNTFCLSPQAQSTRYKSAFADAFISAHSPRGAADPHRLCGADKWNWALGDNQPRHAGQWCTLIVALLRRSASNRKSHCIWVALADAGRGSEGNVMEPRPAMMMDVCCSLATNSSQQLVALQTWLSRRN